MRVVIKEQKNNAQIYPLGIVHTAVPYTTRPKTTAVIMLKMAYA